MEYPIWEIALFIFAICFLGLVKKSRVIFDLNKWQETRHEKNLIKLKNLCPHMILTKVDNQWGFQSLWVSPSGTLDWHCEQCGQVSSRNRFLDDQARWQGDLQGLLNQIKEFDAQAKKMGLTSK